MPLALALCAPGAGRSARKLPPTVAIRVAAQGLGWAVRQESALLLRHLWPLTAIGLTGPASVRRAIASAVLVDLAVALSERRDDPPLDLLSLVVGRRLDDLAYGTGLWCGALKARSPRVLLTRRPGPSAGEVGR
jgi:hypothetical protein